MLKIVSLIAALSFCLSAHADTMAVYKLNVTTTTTGGGAIQKFKYGGFFILDEISGVTIIRANAISKQFSVEQPTYEYAFSNAGNGKTVEAVGIVGGVFWNMDVKGTDKLNPIYAGTWNTVASTFAVSGTDRFNDIFNIVYIREYKGSLILDKVNSAAAVQQDLTIDQVIQRLKDSLIAGGYSEQ